MKKKFFESVAYINDLYNTVKSGKITKNDLCKMEIVCAIVDLLRYEEARVQEEGEEA